MKPIEDTTHPGHIFRRTKIIATLGPACRSRAKITRLIEAGVDLVRLNMSHGDHDGHRKLVDHVRKSSGRLNSHTGIIMDLCGPKIRVGRFEHGHIKLKDGQGVIVTSRQCTGHDDLIPSQYRRLHQDVRKGHRVLLDDGNLELIVDKVRGTEVHCTVSHGGRLSDHKGMNLPDSNVTAPSLTDKDKRDVLLAIEQQADYLALSFVRNARDVQVLKRFLERNGADIPVIAKIEKPEAVENITEILDVCDAIMIARGDLGIELPAEQVPLVQRRLIDRARLRDKPVIVATQMLDSMIERSRPTRAEVGDVANAALSGTDAVMLSGETASGKHPFAAVETMDRIVREIETNQFQRGEYARIELSDTELERDPIRAAMAHAATELSKKLYLDAMVVPTRSGTTARVISAERPLAAVIGVCTSREMLQRMQLYWGVMPILVPEAVTHDWRTLCRKLSAQTDLTASGRTVLIVSGFNDDPVDNSPVLKVIQL